MQPLCQDHTGIQYHRHNLTEYGKCTTRMDSNVRVHKKTHAIMEHTSASKGLQVLAIGVRPGNNGAGSCCVQSQPFGRQGDQLHPSLCCRIPNNQQCKCIKCCQAQVILSMQSQHGQNNRICSVSILCIIAYCLGVEVIGMHGCLGTKHRTSKPQAVSTKRSTWVLC